MTTLLPQKNRKQLKKQYVISLISNSLTYLFFIVLIALVLETTVHYVISFEKNVLEKESNISSRKEEKELMEIFREKNNEIKKYKNLFSENNNLNKTPVIDFVFDIVPEGVLLESVSVEEGEELIFVGVTGLADSREILVGFTSLLEENESVSDVDLPASSFTKTSDIPFSITFVYIHEKE